MIRKQNVSNQNFQLSMWGANHSQITWENVPYQLVSCKSQSSNQQDNHNSSDNIITACVAFYHTKKSLYKRYLPHYRNIRIIECVTITAI